MIKVNVNAAGSRGSKAMTGTPALPGSVFSLYKSFPSVTGSADVSRDRLAQLGPHDGWTRQISHDPRQDKPVQQIKVFCQINR